MRCDWWRYVSCVHWVIAFGLTVLQQMPVVSFLLKKWTNLSKRSPRHGVFVSGSHSKHLKKLNCGWNHSRHLLSVGDMVGMQTTYSMSALCRNDSWYVTVKSQVLRPHRQNHRSVEEVSWKGRRFVRYYSWISRCCGSQGHGIRW